MDGSNPKIVLLDESARMSNLTSFKTSIGEVQLSDWTTDQRYNTTVHLNSNEQSNMNNKKKMSSVTDRGSLRRRFSPNFNSRCKKFSVKFEHYANSCQFIEQYRNAKILQLEKAFQKLLEDSCSSKKTTQSCSKEKAVTRIRPCSSVETPSNGSIIGQSDINNAEDMVTPSLPKTGYFSGKKWVCPKPVYLQPHRPYSQAKRPIGPGRLSSKKSNLEVRKVYDPRTLCLKGTGKPIINNNVKSWVSSRKTACKSAPLSNQRMWTNLLSPKIRPTMNNQSASRVQSYCGYHRYQDELNTEEPTITNNTFIHLSKVERTSDHSAQSESTEYENMFHNVIQHYKQPKEQSGSHVYVRIGT